jgi:hypothetical protein
VVGWGSPWDRSVGSASEHAKGEEESLYRARNVAVTGKLKVRLIHTYTRTSRHTRAHTHMPLTRVFVILNTNGLTLFFEV